MNNHQQLSEEMTAYILRYAKDLMTEHEQRVLLATDKLRLQYQCASKTGKQQARILFKADKDPVIDQALSGDAQTLRINIAQRIYNDHPDFIKRCPFCADILRTPKARQCKSCFKAWRD